MLDSVLIWADKNRGRWLEDLQQWLAIPSISAQQSHDADVAAAAEWAMLNLRGIGLTAEMISTPGHPCVYATTPLGLCPPHAPHILFYGHYDVQPAQIEDGWQTPPFKPTKKNGALIARGASDDKGQVHAHLAALLAWREIASELPVRLTVLLEGEEEIGSLHLRTVMEQCKDQLKSAQALIISDCAQFATGVPAITCGLRGLMYYQLDVQGPEADLHSGLFGGAVANPANALVEMLARLHDGQGRVTLPEFYDDVVPADEELRRQWRNLPFTDAQFAREAGIATPFGETGYTTLERRWIRPTLDINGLWSGYQGPGAKTVLPAKAGVKLSMRLVPNQDPLKIAAAFEAFIKQITPPGVTVTLTSLGASPAALTPTDSPAMQAAVEALQIGFGQDPVYVRDGGSIPVVGWFKQMFNLDAVMLGFGLPDDHIHGPNEKLNLDGYYAGIRTAAALYDLLGKKLQDG